MVAIRRGPFRARKRLLLDLYSIDIASRDSISQITLMYNNVAMVTIWLYCYRNETSKLLASAMGPGLQDAEIGWETPAYVAVRNEIKADMDSIKELMEELRLLHGRASLSTFDDGRDDEVAVEIATQQITRLFRRCEKALQEFGKSFIHTSSDSVEYKVQMNLQKTLALDLQRLSLDFRKQQKGYLIKLRDRDGGNKAAANAIGLIDSGPIDDATYDPGFSEQQALQVDSSAVLAQERDEEVMKIMSSIHDLAQIMKDLSTLVIEQGTILDRIDYNLEETSSRVEQGVSQLRRAERAQRRGILASCVLILVIMVAVMFVVLLVKTLLI